MNSEKPLKLFITGNGTGVGKTIISAILAEALEADYWKTLQAGDLDQLDSSLVRSLISNHKTKFHPEAYKLTQPLSPHAAAAIDGVTIDLEKITAPQTSNVLITEGCGGLLVPLNSKQLVIDLIQKLDMRVVIVSKNYLGSINHTLLTIEVLKSRDIPIHGIIFNGDRTPATEEYILNYSGVKLLGTVDNLDPLDKVSVKATAVKFSAI